MCLMIDSFISGTTDQYSATIDETLAPNSYFATIFATDADTQVIDQDYFFYRFVNLLIS